MTLSMYNLAMRLRGNVKERPGKLDDPFILWCLELVGYPDAHDEVPWCAALMSRLAWFCELPYSKTANARSWMSVGMPLMDLDVCRAGGNDIVVLGRGSNPKAGHVGLYASHTNETVTLLGGNQSNGVNFQNFPRATILAVRRVM